MHFHGSQPSAQTAFSVLSNRSVQRKSFPGPAPLVSASPSQGSIFDFFLCTTGVFLKVVCATRKCMSHRMFVKNSSNPPIFRSDPGKICRCRNCRRIKRHIRKLIAQKVVLLVKICCTGYS